MAAQQDDGKADDDMFLADLFLAEEKAKEAKEGDRPSFSVRFVERDADGRPLVKRSRMESRRRRSAKVTSVAASEVPSPSEPADMVPIRTELNFSEQFLDSEIEKLQEILGSAAETQDECPSASTSSSWGLRQSAAQDEWRKERPYHLDCLLSSRVVPERQCSHCSSPAILRCRDCMPEEWMCGDCDVNRHKTLVLHNRESCIAGFYRPIAPTVSCRKEDGQYTLGNQVRLLPTVRPVHTCLHCDPAHMTESAGRKTILITINGRYDLHLPTLACTSCHFTWTPERSDLIQSGYWPASVHADTLFAVDVFTTFEELKIAAPGLSRQGFLQQLEHRTQRFGRVGKIHGDVFQRSFLEYTYCQFLCDKMVNVEHFTCPACVPNMLAVSADGNRKLYRFRQSKGSEEPYFHGTFIAKDEDVSCFVDEVRSKVKNIKGRGTCGASQWSAARETARRANKLDEEGLEIAVCRHGVLLKSINMYRGEIFAYPLYLQKELQAAAEVTFYCTDIACKYWPYLQKVSACMPELHPLLQMSPFLSVMHAKAHSTKCEIAWSGRNQEGAGTTAGEEVEMVNSYLSRCAISTKYMTKSARNDMLTIHAIGWNVRKHDGLHRALSKRYVKTVRNADAESQRLQDLSRELGCPEDTVQHWVEDVQQWATDDSTDGTQDDQHTLQQSIEHMFLAVSQKKASLYSQTDSNKIRGLRRRKLAVEKRKLFDSIKEYNEQVPEDCINEDLVETRLSQVGSASGEDCLIWPWEVHSNETTSIMTKKKIFDAYMSSKRLQEEKVLIVREMRQHCSSLQRKTDNLRTLISDMFSGGNCGSLTEGGRYGLLCLLRERLADEEDKLLVVSTTYSQALGAVFLEDLSEEMPEEHEGLEYESSEDSDLEDV